MKKLQWQPIVGLAAMLVCAALILGCWFWYDTAVDRSGWVTRNDITYYKDLDDFFARNVLHKAVFSIIAWVLYAILLWGHHAKGWRGMIALRWTIGGFLALALAYWGSKLVIEYILQG